MLKGSFFLLPACNVVIKGFGMELFVEEGKLLKGNPRVLMNQMTATCEEVTGQ